MTETEKDAFIVQLRGEVAKYREAYKLTKYQLDKTLKEKRHQKYKRCLATAIACDKYAFALELQGQGRSTELLKCHNRAIERKYKWLELADKFKKGK